MDAALKHAEDTACEDAKAKAEAAGARGIVLSAVRDVNIVQLGGDKELFIEAAIHGMATGTLR